MHKILEHSMYDLNCISFIAKPLCMLVKKVPAWVWSVLVLSCSAYLIIKALYPNGI